jgi:hypothetical protein
MLKHDLYFLYIKTNILNKIKSQAYLKSQPGIRKTGREFIPASRHGGAIPFHLHVTGRRICRLPNEPHARLRESEPRGADR